jgi:hypothetical protein
LAEILPLTIGSRKRGFPNETLLWPDAAYERIGNSLGDLGKTVWIWLRVDLFGPDLKSIRSVNDPRGDV